MALQVEIDVIKDGAGIKSSIDSNLKLDGLAMPHSKLIMN